MIDAMCGGEAKNFPKVKLWSQSRLPAAPAATLWQDEALTPSQCLCQHVGRRVRTDAFTPHRARTLTTQSNMRWCVRRAPELRLLRVIGHVLANSTRFR